MTIDNVLPWLVAISVIAGAIWSVAGIKGTTRELRVTITTMTEQIKGLRADLDRMRDDFRQLELQMARQFPGARPERCKSAHKRIGIEHA